MNLKTIQPVYKRKTNFLAKLKRSDNVLIGLFSNVISMELSDLQLNYALDLSLIYYIISSIYTFFIFVKYN